MRKSNWSTLVFGAVLTLQGAAISRTETHVLIQDGKTVYHVRKDSLSSRQLASLETAKAPMAIGVPLEGIDLVRTAKKSEKN